MGRDGPVRSGTWRPRSAGGADGWLPKAAAVAPYVDFAKGGATAITLSPFVSEDGPQGDGLCVSSDGEAGSRAGETSRRFPAGNPDSVPLCSRARAHGPSLGFRCVASGVTRHPGRRISNMKLSEESLQDVRSLSARLNQDPLNLALQLLQLDQRAATWFESAGVRTVPPGPRRGNFFSSTR